MKLKNKFVKMLGIIAVIGTIIFVGGHNFSVQKTVTNATKAISLVDKKDSLILVNKQNPVDENYKPSNLVKVNVNFLDDTPEESRYLEKEAAKAVEELFQGARAQGITLIGSSAYRSYQSQVRIMNEQTYKKGYGYATTHVAKPGESEHQSGLAIDVTNKCRCFDKTSKEAQWLANNAYKYGFILRYPEGKESITGYDYEPWHVRYVGKDVAKEIYNRGITLEEYLQNRV